MLHVLPPGPTPPITHLTHLFVLNGCLDPLVFCNHWPLTCHILHPVGASLDRISFAHHLWPYLSSVRNDSHRSNTASEHVGLVQPVCHTEAQGIWVQPRTH